MPVDPRSVARARRVTVSFGDYGEAFDGMLEHRAGRFHIFCNQQRVGAPGAPRARFTLAHELGHYYIDGHRSALESGHAPPHLSRCDHESALLAEQQADHFAANLLMPAARFSIKARAAPRGLAGILTLAAEFGVSLTSAAIRCAEADAHPCAVVKWDWRGYSWKRLSSSAFQARLRRTFELPSELAEDSPTRRALAHESPPARGWFEAGTVASAWFPGVREEDTRNLILIEQAIPLGRFGVLTFLYLA